MCQNGEKHSIHYLHDGLHSCDSAQINTTADTILCKPCKPFASTYSIAISSEGGTSGGEGDGARDLGLGSVGSDVRVTRGISGGVGCDIAHVRVWIISVCCATSHI